jgi:hypothetical protein
LGKKILLAKNLPKVIHPEKIRGKFFRVGKKFTKSDPPRKNLRKIFFFFSFGKIKNWKKKLNKKKQPVIL